VHLSAERAGIGRKSEHTVFELDYQPDQQLNMAIVSSPNSSTSPKGKIRLLMEMIPISPAMTVNVSSLQSLQPVHSCLLEAHQDTGYYRLAMGTLPRLANLTIPISPQLGPALATLRIETDIS